LGLFITRFYLDKYAIMEKIRNMLYVFNFNSPPTKILLSVANSRSNNSGGGNKAEEGTYDPDSYSQTATHHSTTGKPTGEGSHLSSVTGNTGTYLSQSVIILPSVPYCGVSRSKANL
jgi:hypothetical protein